MIIQQLPNQYNDKTHVRLMGMNLSDFPITCHFKLGNFQFPEESTDTIPELPYTGSEAPSGWIESSEYNTAEFDTPILTIDDLVIAIDGYLQSHS